MSSSINFSGLGSNIDFNAIRDAIISDRMRPITQLQARTANLGSRSSALKQLNGLLANLTNASDSLTNNQLGTGRTANTSDSAVAYATATTAAGLGTFNLIVGRLATTLSQASRTFTATSDTVLAGGATSATFELRKGGAVTGTSFTIDASNNSLAGLRDAINAAGAGVTASIVDLSGDGTQNQLVLNSTAAGTSGRVELVETTTTGTGADLTLRSLNPPGAVGDFSALDAQLTLNGLTITRSSNSVSDAVSGVTFNLQKAGTAKIEITQAADISDDLQTFVDAYNAVQNFISAQYKPDGDGKPTGVLAGDATLRLVQHQLRDSVSALSSANGGVLTSLSDIGLGRDANDNLTLDSAKLNSKLQGSLSDVRALLFGKTTGDTGIFETIHAAFNNLSDNVSGVVQTAINGYQSSINTLNKSILDQTRRISDLKDTLSRQFAAVDAAIGQLNSQGTALTNIMAALQPKSK